MAGLLCFGALPYWCFWPPFCHQRPGFFTVSLRGRQLADQGEMPIWGGEKMKSCWNHPRSHKVNMFLEREHWEKKDYSLVSGLWKGQFNHNMAKLLLATSDAFEKWEIGGRIQMSATTEVPLSKIPISQMFICSASGIPCLYPYANGIAPSILPLTLKGTEWIGISARWSQKQVFQLERWKAEQWGLVLNAQLM